MGKFGQSLILLLVSSATLLAQSNSLTSATPKEAITPAIRTSFEAILSKTLDARKSKPGDLVLARTTEDISLKGDVQIPKYAKLIGHLADVQVKGRGASDSRMAVVFDKAQMRDGREVPLQISILNVTPADDSVEAQSNANRAKRFDILENSGTDSTQSVLRSNTDNLRIESGSRLTLRLTKQ